MPLSDFKHCTATQCSLHLKLQLHHKQQIGGNQEAKKTEN